jgi:DNA-binding NarL/FixJ family response regulator
MTTAVAPTLRELPGLLDRRSRRRLTSVISRSEQSVHEAPIFLIDDDAMARGWLRLSLRGSEFPVVREAASAAEALNLISQAEPGLLLVDHRLPDSGGIELIRELRDRGVTAPAILLATTSQPGLNEAAREAGAEGTLLKTGSASELLEALRAVETGRESFDSRHPRRPPVCSTLSPREREVLILVAEGATNSEIASVLGIGIETVKTLLRRTFAKLGVQRQVQAVWAARELGIV